MSETATDKPPTSETLAQKATKTATPPAPLASPFNPTIGDVDALRAEVNRLTRLEENVVLRLARTTRALYWSNARLFYTLGELCHGKGVLDTATFPVQFGGK